MTEAQQRSAAKSFAAFWKDKGYEKGESQAFWLSLLRSVFGVEEPERFIRFEDQVHLDHTSFIDGFIPATRVLIEQKSLGKNLLAPIRQSDGSLLTPFQQAKRYVTELPVSKHPRWIVTCNFSTFMVYDMEKPNGEPETIELKDLEKEYYRLQFLVDAGDTSIQREMEISIQAGELVGKLYDAFLKQYINPQDDRTLKSLNMLCVRLVFCLYAEDAGIFGRHNMFHNYMQNAGVRNARRALVDLFKMLDTKPEDRDPYEDPELLAFPYVNGGLFSDEDIIIPHFTNEILDLLLHKASEDFDWRDISPTIFGAVFESTLNPETRRSGGMHYTSIENIHKVIDPLFLNALRRELDEIKAVNVIRTRKEKLTAFQKKLSDLTFLDPACGSGNFLTETYISLRRLENEIIRTLIDDQKGAAAGQIMWELEGDLTPIMVSIQQFYGIEINDFAATVAKTALWIAESQMMKQTEDIVNMNLNFLPLKSYVNIVEGNALRLNWEDVVPKDKLDYIMGNPPFVGGMYMNSTQKAEMYDIFPNVSGVGEMDYVCAWYKKAADILDSTKIRVAYVSTNSICQGEQVLTFWRHMMESCHIHIDFAYSPFVWNSESKGQAKVHCVIIGFSGPQVTPDAKKLFVSSTNYKECNNISPYLCDAPDCFIESRSTPLCNVPPMRFGSMPRDGGHFVLSPDERRELVVAEPLAEQWIRPYIGATEFLNNKERYCLWLVNANPQDLKKCKSVMKRIESVKEFRAASKAAGTRKFAATPTLFCQIAQPDTNYIMVPKTSSGKRKYLPLGFQSADVIASDLVFLIPDASLYEFGILMSNVHNAWMRLVAGRLKSDYRYSKDIVYNNFPWPTPTDAQKAAIEQTAQAILDARALYPDCSLADLYDEVTMPVELRRAHQANDKAVMQAYGFWGSVKTESDCVARLMEMYAELTK